MAANVLFNMTDGNGGIKTAKGWEVTEVATVTDLDEFTARAKIGEAVKAIEAAGQTIGSTHPEADPGLQLTLQRFQPVAVAPNIVKVSMFYMQRGPEATLISTGSRLEQIERNTSLNGTLMTVSFNGKTQTGTVSDTIAVHSRTYQRVENFDPSEISKEFTNTINAEEWEMDTQAAEGTWRCDSIEGNSDDSGATFTTTYSFSHKPDVWAPVIYYIDPETGRPPAGLTEGDGIASYFTKEIKDFNELNLLGN